MRDFGAQQMAPDTPHLAINLVQLLPGGSGGIESYARSLIPRVTDRLEGWRVSVHVNREGFDAYREWDDRVEWKDAGFSWNSRLMRFVAESTTVPRAVRASRADLLHSMCNVACLRPGCPQLTTVFDTTQLTEPADGLPARAFQLLLGRAGARSDRIVTISESAASDVREVFDGDTSSIDVALLAAMTTDQRIDPNELSELLTFPADQPYILTPAARRPNKNIPRLLEAFARIDTQIRPRLVLVGADAGLDERLRTLAAELGVDDEAVVLGWVSDAELATLYEHATVMVFPSLKEGFGLPILEAMHYRCPVATSNVSSMPEVAGDAAVYFDPMDPQSMATEIGRLLSDPDLRSSLATRGVERAAQFSWDRTADQTVEIYRSMVRPR